MKRFQNRCFFLKKRTVILILIILSCIGLQKAFPQAGIQLSYLKFSGDVAYFFKPALSFEAIYDGKMEYSHFGFGATIGYNKLKTMQDTIRYLIFENGSKAIPCYEVFENISNLSITFRSNYFILDKSLSPFVGFDVVFNILEYDLHRLEPGWIEYESSNDTEARIGFMPRAGLAYTLNEKIMFRADLGKCWAYGPGGRQMFYWKSAISAVYLFDN